MMHDDTNHLQNNNSCVVPKSGAEVDVLLDRAVFQLNVDEFRQMEELLDSAQEPNEALREFVRRRPPWDCDR